MGNSKKSRARARRTQAREVARARQRKAQVRLVSSILVAVLIVGILGSTVLVLLATRPDEEDESAASSSTTTTAPNPCPPAEMPPLKEIALPAPSFEDDPQIDPDKAYTAVITTSCGEMTFALDPATAPEDVNNFVYLANQGFYDGVIFHRVINGFMIQGGDPTAPDTARAGMGGPGYQYTGSTPTPPPDGSNTYKVGSLAMANSGGPSTNGSQFFIVSGPQGEALPPNYSLFGQMTAGLEVLDMIQRVPTSGSDYPVTPVVIQKVTVTES